MRRLAKGLVVKFSGPLLLLTNAALIVAYNSEVGKMIEETPEGRIPRSINANSLKLSGCKDNQIFEMLAQVVRWIGLSQALNSYFTADSYTGKLRDGTTFTLKNIETTGTGFSVNFESVEGTCDPSTKFEL